MALDLFTGAAAGAVAGELLKAVLDAKDKAVGFEFHLERLEITLASVIPHVHLMQQLDEELNRPGLELARLVLQLEKGMELVRKCSAVTCANYYKRYSYSERILKLDASLQRFFNMEMQVTMSRDVKETLKEMFALRQELCEMRNRGGEGANQLQVANSGQQQTVPEEPDHSIGLSNTSSSVSYEEDGGGIRSNSLSPKEHAAVQKSDDEDGIVAAAENKRRVKLGLALKSVKMKSLLNMLFRYNKEDKESKVSKMAKLRKGGAELFTFRELRAATNNFADNRVIGRGGHGTVFLGVLVDGQKVAIKEIRRASEFEVELEILSRLHHKHLVRLVGFCDEIDNKGLLLLVYEFLENGSLFEILHSPNLYEHEKSALGTWKMRVRIALEVARGIDYLHNHSVPCIIHRDIKTINILLDANWRAKIIDFGLAVSSEKMDAVNASTPISGTYGYMAPEYARTEELTVKADVYAFGVVLLELLTGKKAIEAREFEDCFTLPRYVAKLIKLALEHDDWELKRVLDPRLSPPNLDELRALEKVIYTAMRCTDVRPNRRTSITQVVADLERAWACFEDNHRAADFVICPNPPWWSNMHVWETG